MKTGPSAVKIPGWACISILACVLLALFWRCLLPGYTLFANDGPLGNLSQESHRMPGMFFGTWEDLNSLGNRAGALLNLSFSIFCALGPVGFSKFNAPIALLILAVGAWVFFRRLSLAPLACVLAAAGAMLNSGFFSAACWGVATHAVTIGMSFFALAALVDTSSKRRWLYVIVSGFAVGIGV